jgi:fused signal recognition particle receptor
MDLWTEYATQLTEQPLLLAGGVAALLLVLLLVALIARRRRGARQVEAEGAQGLPAPSGLVYGLAKTRAGLWSRLRGAWQETQVGSSRLAQLEEVLLTADVGVNATQTLLDKVRAVVDRGGDVQELRQALRAEMVAILGDAAQPPALQAPHVILVAGVNGVGKTTSIGKLAHRFRAEGKKVLLVAADTFRAAAAEQLQMWADRVGAECVRHQSGADPSAVAFDGMSAATARGVDVVIVDTAGRLHVKQHLIEELKKIVRIIGRQIPGAPHEVWLVIDATTGQNALVQARVFQEALSLTGIILTKLDGTAKGGVVFAVKADLGVPVRYIGIGEKPEDLQPFDAEQFVDALLTPE